MSHQSFISIAIAIAIQITLANGVVGEEKLPSRWAIVASGEASQILADLLTVELSSWDKVQLVERGEIRRVLDELKLSLSAAAEDSELANLNRLMQADAILLLSKADERSGIRVRLIETRSSVRLLDILLPASGSESETKAIRWELEQVTDKLEVPDRTRQFIGVATIISEEPGKYLRPYAQSLKKLVETGLHQIPQLVVLERSELRRLTEERDLSGAQLMLRASMVLVEIGVKRYGEASMIATCQLTSPGKVTRHFQIQVESTEILDMRAHLVDAIAQQLQIEKASSKQPPPIEAEALEFDRRCKWFEAAYRPDDAVEMAEAALALENTRERIFKTRHVYEICLHDHKNRDTIHPKLAEYQERILQLKMMSIEFDARNETGFLLRMALRSYMAHPILKDPVWDRQIRSILIRRVNEDLDQLYSNSAKSPRLRSTAILDRLLILKYLTLSNKELIETFIPLFEECVESIEQANIVDDPPRIDGPILKLTQTEHYFMQIAEQLMDVVWLFCNTAEQANTKGEAIPDIADFIDRYANHPQLPVRLAFLHGRTIKRDDEGARAAKLLLEETDRWTPRIHKLQPRIPLSDKYAAPDRNGVWETRIKDSQYAEEYVLNLLKSGVETENTQLIQYHWQLLISFIRSGKITKKDELVSSVLAAYKLFDRQNVETHWLQDNLLAFLTANGVRLADPERNKGGVAWQSYTEKFVQLQTIDPDNQLLRVEEMRTKQGNPLGELLLLWSTRWGKVAIERVGIAGGIPQRIGPEIMGFPGSFNKSWIADAPDHFFYLTEHHGLAVLSKNGGSNQPAIFTEEQGAPSLEILCAAWFGDRLYIGFKDSFASFDPQKGEFTLLASSLSLQPVNPIDGRGSFFIRSIYADEANGRVWMVIQDNTASRDRNGFWCFEPDSNSYEKISKYNIDAFELDEGFYLDLHIPNRWAYVDKRTKAFKQLRQYQDGPSGRFIVIGDHIILDSGALLTPDRQIHLQSIEEQFGRLFLPLNNGFITKYDASQKKLWYFERKSP